MDTDKNNVASYEWEMVPINDAHCPRDLQLEALIDKYKEVTDRKYARIVTRFNRILTHPKRNTETSLGNLFADIFCESLGLDIMLLGSGSIRNEKLGTLVDYGNLKETFPYDDEIYMMKIDGGKFKRMMKYMLRDEAFSGETEFYQLSKGLRLVYSKGQKAFKSMTYNGKEIEDEDVFTVGLQNFHFSNLENFLGISFKEAEEIQKPRVVSTSCLDVVEEYLGKHHLLDRDVEGRIIIED